MFRYIVFTDFCVFLCHLTIFDMLIFSSQIKSILNLKDRVEMSITKCLSYKWVLGDLFHRKIKC